MMEIDRRGSIRSNKMQKTIDGEGQRQKAKRQASTGDALGYSVPQRVSRGRMLQRKL